MRTLTFPQRVTETQESNPALLQAAWYISQATGNDNGTGAIGDPLATLAELRRRLGYNAYISIPLMEIFILDGNFDKFDPCNFNFIIDAPTQINFYGTRNVIYSGSFSAVTVLNRNTPTRPTVTDAGAVGTWADGLLLETTNGTPKHSWVTSADLGGGTVRTAAWFEQPTPFASPAMTASNQAVSDTFNLSTLPVISTGIITVTGTNALTGSSGTVNFDALELGGAAAGPGGRFILNASSTTSFWYLTNCKIGAIRHQGSGAILHKNSYFYATNRLASGVDVVTLAGFTHANAIHQHYIGLLEFDYDHLCEGFINNPDWGTGDLFIGTLGIFRASANGLAIGAGRIVTNKPDISGTVLLYGSQSGSGYGLSMESKSTFLYTVKPTITGATGDCFVGSVAKTWAAIPFIDLGTGTYLGDGTAAPGASTQTITAPGVLYTIAGTSTLVAGTVTISAPITASSRIVTSIKDPNPGAGNLTVGLSAPNASRNVGAGTFAIQANVAAGTINVLDTSTIDWAVFG